MQLERQEAQDQQMHSSIITAAPARRLDDSAVERGSSGKTFEFTV